MAYDCELVFCEGILEIPLGLSMRHFLSHEQYDLPILCGCLAQQTAKLAQKSRIFSFATPSDFVRSFPLGQIR